MVIELLLYFTPFINKKLKKDYKHHPILFYNSEIVFTNNIYYKYSNEY
jgi:hypothetical protein